MNRQHAGTDVDGLEHAWDDPAEPRCEALTEKVPGRAPGHACTVVARWVVHSTCRGTARLWCEGRYQRHLQRVADRVRCAHCGQPVTHWVVTPL